MYIPIMLTFMEQNNLFHLKCCQIWSNLSIKITINLMITFFQINHPLHLTSTKKLHRGNFSCVCFYMCLLYPFIVTWQKRRRKSFCGLGLLKTAGMWCKNNSALYFNLNIKSMLRKAICWQPISGSLKLCQSWSQLPDGALTVNPSS